MARIPRAVIFGGFSMRAYLVKGEATTREVTAGDRVAYHHGGDGHTYRAEVVKVLPNGNVALRAQGWLGTHHAAVETLSYVSGKPAPVPLPEARAKGQRVVAHVEGREPYTVAGDLDDNGADFWLAHFRRSYPDATFALVGGAA
jgi:hypothetical protein